MKVKTSHTELKMRRYPEQERSKSTISTILTTAARLFGEAGVDTVSMTQIAKEAGMSKPALYRYFSSKQAIIQQLAEQMFEDNKQLIITHLLNISASETSSQLEQVKTVFTAALTEYCNLHIEEPYRIKLRAAIYADPLLAENDMQDSRENAKVLTEYLSHLFPALDKTVVLPKMLLLAELADSLVRLVAKVNKEEKKRLIEEYANLFLTGLD